MLYLRMQFYSKNFATSNSCVNKTLFFCLPKWKIVIQILRKICYLSILYTSLYMNSTTFSINLITINGRTASAIHLNDSITHFLLFLIVMKSSHTAFILCLPIEWADVPTLFTYVTIVTEPQYQTSVHHRIMSFMTIWHSWICVAKGQD